MARSVSSLMRRIKVGNEFNGEGVIFAGLDNDSTVGLLVALGHYFIKRLISVVVVVTFFFS